MQNLNNASKKMGTRGQGLVEYILVVFLMAVLSIVAVRGLASSTKNGFTKASTKLDQSFAG